MTLGIETLETRLKAMEERLLKLETAPRAPHTSVQNGSFTILDDTGKTVAKFDRDGFKMYDAAAVLRLQIGFIDAGAGYGVKVFTTVGQSLFEANDDGLRFPALNTPWIPQIATFTGLFTPITDAAFVNVYQAEFSQITHLGFASTVTSTSDAGTTGEFRVSADAGGSTSTITVPAGSAGTSQAFEWLHGLNLNSGPTSFRVQARRTGGAGAINVYLPARASLVNNLVCSASGL